MSRSIHHLHCAAYFAAVLVVALSQPVQADIYVLVNDGQVHGELVNGNESPRQKYVIATPEGATITFDRAQVKQIIPQSAAEMEFEKIRPDVRRHGRGSVALGRMVPRKFAHSPAASRAGTRYRIESGNAPGSNGVGLSTGRRPLDAKRRDHARAAVTYGTRTNGCCRKKWK